MTTREAIEARLLTLLPETQAIMVNVSQLRDICASHATVEAERDEWRMAAQTRLDRAVYAEARAEALARAVRALAIDANRLCDRNLGGTYEDDCRRSIAAALLALDVQESS